MSILMSILSKKNEEDRQLGATEVEILKALNIKNRNKSFYFHRLITNFSKYVEPLGLQVRFNPVDSHWFITFEPEVSDILSANPFQGKPRLAATLFCVLMCCLNNSGVGKISDIKNLRRKKNILEDLKELEKMGFIGITQDLGQVFLTPLIGYQLDLEKLLIKLALKLK